MKDNIKITKNKDGVMSTFTKEFTSTKKKTNGDKVFMTYEFNPDVKSKNELLSEKMDETIKDFTKESKAVYTDDFKKHLKLGSQVRYIARDKKGNLKARLGGSVMKIEDDYVMIMNMRTKLAWSVQYVNLVKLFLIRNALTKEEKEQEAQKKLNDIEKKQIEKKEKQIAKELKKQEKLEKNKQLKKEKEEQKKLKKQLREEKKAEKEKQKLPEEKSKRKLEKEKSFAKLLNEYYYDKDMKYGRDKLHKTIKSDGHKIARDFVGKWLNEQKLHQLTKKVEKVKNTQIIQSKAPYNVMNLDLVEIEGIPVMNIIDSFSRIGYARVIPNKTQKSVIAALTTVMKDNDFKPRMIVSDNGPEFTGKDFVKFLKDREIKHQTTTSHNPQANGKIERLNGTIKRLFKKMELSEPELKMNQTTLNRMMKSYNESVHSVIKMKPVDALKEENLEKVRDINDIRENFASKKDKDDLEVGDKVRIVVKHENKDSKSLRPNWSEEVYKIKSIRRPRKVLVNPIQYKLSGAPRIERGYYKRGELQKITAVKNQKYAQPKFIIDKILDMNGSKILIRWKGYTKDYDSWESKSSIKRDVGIDNYNDFIEDYEKRTQK